MAYKMNKCWTLLKPCHVFPDWMMVEGIVQLGVSVVQEDEEGPLLDLPVIYDGTCTPCSKLTPTCQHTYMKHVPTSYSAALHHQSPQYFTYVLHNYTTSLT